MTQTDYTIPVAPPISIDVALPKMSAFKHSVEECLSVGGARNAMAPIWLDPQNRTLTVDIPAMSIDVLHNPYVFGGHVTQMRGNRHVSGQLLLNSSLEIGSYSYGIMDGAPTLPLGLCGDKEDRFVGKIENETRLTGDFLFLGTAHIHFGHIIVEGLSRLWGLSHLKDRLCTPKYMTYETIVRDFAFELFDIAGVNRSQIIGSPPLGRPERLFVPCTSMRTHHWIAPQQSKVWDDIAARADNRMRNYTGAKKVYLSRSAVEGRSLRNELEIEALFASKGFQIIHPQNLPVLEQVKVAYDAEVLAGCAGSQMYLAAFQKRGGCNIILAPENFFLPDDVLIAHAKEHKLSVFFGSLIDQFHREGWYLDATELRSFLDDMPALR